MKAQLEKLFRAEKKTESLAAKAFEAMVKELEAVTDCKLEAGIVWAFESGLGSRVRSRTGLRSIKSDCWEAALCLTFNKERLWADAYVFVFKDDKVLCENGFADERTFGRFFHYTLKDWRWQPVGWSYGEGSGEWEWVQKPGDEFKQDKILLSQERFSEKDPVLVEWQMDPLEPVKESFIFPVSVKRGHSKRNYAGGTSLLNRKKRLKAVNNAVDLSQWSISGGWIPGKYHVILRRVNYYEANDDRLFDLHISEPFTFCIV